MNTEPSPSSRPGSRQRVPLHSPDLSGFAKSLRRQLLGHHAEHAEPPSHTQLLQMLAHAAGHRNWQAMRALAPMLASEPPADAPPVVDDAAEVASAPLTAAAAKALTQFDDWGRLTRWPHKHSVQRLAMWVLWTRFDTGRRYTEREVNELLKAWTIYGDHVTPRRELINMGLLAREDDCSAYWKQPQRPADEVQALLQAVRERSRQGLRLPR
jgi:hypothetical protein